VAISSRTLQWRSHRFRSPRKIQHPLAREFSYNGNDNNEVAVTKDNPNPPDSAEDEQQNQPVASQEVEDFFHRLPGSFRWPKPNAEAVAAAVEAIHRMSGSEAEAAPSLATGDDSKAVAACPSCGCSLPTGARFCVWCGIPTESLAGDAGASSRPATGQHHFHHHYHHLVPSSAVSSHASGAVAPAAESGSTGPRGRAPGVAGTSIGGRAEAAARQIAQDWAQACNTRHIDDLLELYSADATLIRSSVPPVRSLPAIREFLVSLLEAGLGDVEMESLRLEMMGDVAFDLGRCKMLVPVAMGKRREERGKYLVVLVRQPAGTWKILADCWSADLTVTAPPLEPAVRKGSEPTPPVRKTR
jgi:ketosteroid isomerase-like protein